MLVIAQKRCKSSQNPVHSVKMWTTVSINTSFRVPTFDWALPLIKDKCTSHHLMWTLSSEWYWTKNGNLSSNAEVGDQAVNFMFKNDCDILIKWHDMMVGEFWLKTGCICLKPADIKHKMLALAILVPLPAVSFIRKFITLHLKANIIQHSDNEHEEASTLISAKWKKKNRNHDSILSNGSQA